MTILMNKKWGGYYSAQERRQGTGLVLSPKRLPKGGLRQNREVISRG